MATRQRPLSPFMIGPVYRPQITSVLSILHRGTGVFLAFGALVLVVWLLAAAGSETAYEMFSAWAGSPVGVLLGVGFAASLVYHFLNGIRHLLWDIGWGYGAQGEPEKAAPVRRMAKLYHSVRNALWGKVLGYGLDSGNDDVTRTGRLVIVLTVLLTAGIVCCATRALGGMA
jgi:succinate dehydrogenase / fumarate reductase, cytochrome b subunit